MGPTLSSEWTAALLDMSRVLESMMSGGQKHPNLSAGDEQPAKHQKSVL